MIDGKLYIFGGQGAVDAFYLDVPRNMALANKYWNEEMNGSNAFIQRSKRLIFRVPHYVSGEELAAQVRAAKKVLAAHRDLEQAGLRASVKRARIARCQHERVNEHALARPSENGVHVAGPVEAPENSSAGLGCVDRIRILGIDIAATIDGQPLPAAPGRLSSSRRRRES